MTNKHKILFIYNTRNESENIRCELEKHTSCCIMSSNDINNIYYSLQEYDYDLILIDNSLGNIIKLSKVCKDVKSNKKFKNIPILILNNQDINDKNIDLYLINPTINEILTCIKTLLKLKDAWDLLLINKNKEDNNNYIFHIKRLLYQKIHNPVMS